MHGARLASQGVLGGSAALVGMHAGGQFVRTDHPVGGLQEDIEEGVSDMLWRIVLRYRHE
jgi:hypothetical protein